MGGTNLARTLTTDVATAINCLCLFGLVRLFAKDFDHLARLARSPNLAQFARTI